MSSRIRVLSTLRHEQPDRPPMVYNGAMPNLAEKIHSHFHVKDEFSLWLKNGVDFWPIRLDQYWRMESNGTPGDCIWPEQFPLSAVTTVKEVEAYFTAFRKYIDVPRLYEEQGVAHLDKFRFVGGGSLFEAAYSLRGFTTLLEDLYLNPDIVEAIIENIFQMNIIRLEQVLTAFNKPDAGTAIDMVTLTDDLGTQQDLIFSIDLFRKYFSPRLRATCDLVHRFGAVVALHSCGSIVNIIPELIAAGIDVLNPIQTSARNMDAASLKQRFGNDLTFWGAIDTQTVFSKGTPDQVRQAVRNMRTILGTKGGYFCSPTHVLTEEVPLENVIAFFEEAY